MRRKDREIVDFSKIEKNNFVSRIFALGNV